MPNYVKNIITFDCDKEEVKQIIDEIKSDDGKTLFDFNKLIPMPEELNIVEGSETDKGITAFETDDKSNPELYELGKQAIKILKNTDTDHGMIGGLYTGKQNGTRSMS